MTKNARARPKDKRLARLRKRTRVWEHEDEDADPKDHAAMRRGMAAFRHWLFTRLHFWTVCPRTCCKRARACVGDVDVCGQSLLPLVPADFKARLYKVMQARDEGLSPEDACRIADDDMRRHDQAMARVPAQHGCCDHPGENGR